MEQTSGLELLLQQFEADPQFQNPEFINQVLAALNFYETEYRKNVSKHGENETVKAMYDLIDQEFDDLPEETKKQFSCKKGCAFCCKIPIESTLAEANVIVQYCKKNNIEIRKEVLEDQITFKQEEWAMQKNKACVFLGENNECKIYEVRPSGCRRYFVSTPPEFCDTETDSHQRVGIAFNWNIEAMVMAMSRGKRELLAKQLLIILKNTK